MHLTSGFHVHVGVLQDMTKVGGESQGKQMLATDKGKSNPEHRLSGHRA